MGAETTSNSHTVEDGVLLKIPEAQLHEVNNGQERLVEWGELRVRTHTSEAGDGLWIQVGKTEWAVTTSMPTLEAQPNTYMFALEKGRFYSVLLAQATPQDLSMTFREILHECTAFEVAGASKLNAKEREEIVNQVAQEVAADEELNNLKPEIAPGATPTASQRILQGAAYAQEKLLASANWASRKIIEQSEAYQAKHPATQDPVNVSPAIQRTVKLARKAAETGSSIANRVAGGIADVTIRIADTIIRHLSPSKTGEELSDPNKRPNAAKEVAAAALMAATGIYDSMEQASRQVLNAGGQASSDFIGHRYGQQAGQVATDATSATITGGMTVLTVQKLGVKKIARRVAKRTAHGLVKAHLFPGHGSGTATQGSQAQAGTQNLASSTSKPQQPGQYGQPTGAAATQQPPPAGQYGLPPTATGQAGQSSATAGQPVVNPAYGQYRPAVSK